MDEHYKDEKGTNLVISMNEKMIVKVENVNYLKMVFYESNDEIVVVLIEVVFLTVINGCSQVKRDYFYFV